MIMNYFRFLKLRIFIKTLKVIENFTTKPIKYKIIFNKNERNQ